VRLACDSDLLFRVNLEVVRRAVERGHQIGVLGAWLSGEILPSKTLHRMQVRRIFLPFDLSQIFLLSRDD
jgi:hypothetical protein